jgi:hypothetical protein
MLNLSLVHLVVHAKRGNCHKEQDCTHALKVLCKVLVLGAVQKQQKVLGLIRRDGDQHAAELQNALQSVHGSPVAHVSDPVHGSIMVEAFCLNA